MRLSRIKLAGFKSFVDPTTFQLPSNLVGIVGPNGCGKSNVIDAVRWVMGEMSAKHLRGDSMADVIFNGSASRKPVGTASIELYFDNSDGTIGGQYAQYTEIGLKRTISRDGTSSYFLNNTKCRRKDITDLFLGTGLGSRSYAIIEQGMVSRLVEAKPDDMRNYIEEAAGISKYKERRRETETRIQHTRDNLARLTDLRDEISKQIDSLQRQARTAERYKEHKARERRLEAELLVLKLGELDRTLDSLRLELSRRDTERESALADQRRIEAEIVAARETHIVATDGFNAVQSRHYAVQSEISRLEQAIAHSRETRDRQRADQALAVEQIREIDLDIQRDEAELEGAARALDELQPALEAAQAAAGASGVRLASAEQSLDDWQQGWQDFNLGLKELQQVSSVERTRIEHLEAQLQQLDRQRHSLAADRGGIVLAELASRIAAQVSQEQILADRTADLQSRLSIADADLDALRAAERNLGSELEQVTAELASRQGQLEALVAIQQTAFGADDDALSGWLGEERLGAEPRLAERLRVEDRWLLAVETVLGDFLQAVCVPGFAHHLSKLPETQVTLIENSAHSGAIDPRSLLARVAEPGRSMSLLANVFTAESLADAVKIQAALADHQSVVTADGVWLGSGWVRVNRGQRSAKGVLTRAHQMRELEVAVSAFQQRIDAAEAERIAIRGRFTETSERRHGLAIDCNAAIREHAEAIAVLDNLRSDLGRAESRSSALDLGIGQLQAEIASLGAALDAARAKASNAESEIASVSARRPALQAQQEALLRAYDEARAHEDRDRTVVAGLNLDFERRRVSRESTLAGLARLTAQRLQLADRLAVLDAEIAQAEPAIAVLQAELAVQLEQQLTVERALSAARGELEQVESGLRANEGRRTATEKVVGAARDASESLRLQVREFEIRRESVLESLAANGAIVEDTLRDMPPEAAVPPWQDALDEVRRKIERLGPINLAAIEQFNEQAERKKYLDAQNDDLMSALDTLEQAIRKIDRETRSRFQETFECINQGLKRIFPRLFGGGHAYLSLEGDDVLAAGVTVMARPPGKRNSHIHLLSGGEKALTAVALIFAIFELNPAPFCLLDEVDAPLDEANVGRFCDIVREMSQRVQFVVITHNKTTMEMTKQLTGVTMNEPGVSRLVSVDLDAAVQLAAS
jgi:chromosome segregation protein